MYSNKFLILVLNIFIIICDDEYERRFVFDIFRHGARSPSGTNLNDKSQDILGETWEGNAGELTNLGKRQLFLLGSITRADFNTDKFLDPVFNTSEIYVISTDYNRTIMSCQAYLQGLYETDKNIQLTPSQETRGIPPFAFDNYQPLIDKLNKLPLPQGIQVLPIHIFDKMGHEYYLHDYDVCPKSRDFIPLNKNDPKIIKANQTLFDKYEEQFKKIPAFKNLNL